MSRSRSVLVAAAASAALLAAACGGGDSGEVADGSITTIEEGVLSVCSDIPYAPFEFEDGEGGFTGFDIDLMRAIAGELDLELEVLVTSFDGIQSGTALASGQCDVAASAMTITEQREENLDFSDPYFDADQSLLVTVDSGIATLEDLSGKTIAVQSETTGAEYAAENAPDDADIIDYPSGAEAISALQAGQVDAVIQDFPVNLEATLNDDNLTVAAEFPTGEQYGFAVTEEGAEPLLEGINTALQTLRDNGTYDDIFDEYFPGAQA